LEKQKLGESKTTKNVGHFGKHNNSYRMGGGTGWAGWACAHPGNNLGEHCPPLIFISWI